MKSQTLKPTTQPTAQSVADVLCVRCGCQCDDLTVELTGDRVTGVHRACPIADQWYRESTQSEDEPAASVRGKPVPIEVAASEAARILRTARAPVVLGLEETTVEAQQWGVRLVESARGTIVGRRPAHVAVERAVQSAGLITATWGEIKQRADVIVVWNSDIATTHPRFLERYGSKSPDRFLPNGADDRTLIVIEEAPSAITPSARHVITIPPNRDLEAAWVLRAILRGVPLEESRVAKTTGVSLEQWNELAQTLRRARYGVILHDPVQCDQAEPATRALVELVLDLQKQTSFRYVPLGSAGNGAGMEQVVAWVSGLGGAADFTTGTARASRSADTIDALLRDHRVDAALIIHADPLADLEPTDWQWLGHIPTIVLASRLTATWESATVSFQSAGLDTDAIGHVFRADGVCLPLRPIRVTGRPQDAQILEAIHERFAAHAE